MKYDNLKETLRVIYYGNNKAFTPEIMNELSLIIWKAEQYNKGEKQE